MVRSTTHDALAFAEAGPMENCQNTPISFFGSMGVGAEGSPHCGAFFWGA
jgi:hypothetical protein